PYNPACEALSASWQGSAQVGQLRAKDHVAIIHRAVAPMILPLALLPYAFARAYDQRVAEPTTGSVREKPSCSGFPLCHETQRFLTVAPREACIRQRTSLTGHLVPVKKHQDGQLSGRLVPARSL